MDVLLTTLHLGPSWGSIGEKANLNRRDPFVEGDLQVWTAQQILLRFHES